MGSWGGKLEGEEGQGPGDTQQETTLPGALDNVGDAAGAATLASHGAG